MKLVLIEWHDSHSSHANAWTPLDELQGAAKPIRCCSVGWLVADENGCKVIVPHLSGENDPTTSIFGRGELSIPNSAIVKMRVLKK